MFSGADVQCGRGLDTPLHAAARVSGAKEAELLLEYGADRTSRNSEGKKPLDLTTDQNIKQLLQAASKYNHTVKALHMPKCTAILIMSLVWFYRSQLPVSAVQMVYSSFPGPKKIK